MKRANVVAAVFWITLLVGSASASPASAGQLWWVNGKVLPQGVTKKVTARVKPGTKILLEGEVSKMAGVIECEKLSLTEGTIYNIENWAHNKNGIVMTGCKGSGLLALCKVVEPIKMPPKTIGEGDIVQNLAKTKVYEDLLPEESGTRKVFMEIVTEGMGCPTITIETKLPNGKEGTANEGEGGILAEVSEPGTEKVVHIMKAICPPEPKKALNATGKEIAVNEYETSTKEKACMKGEAEVEIEKEPWSLK